MTAEQKAIVVWARENAPDITIEEIAVSLNLRASEVRRAARGVQPVSDSKLRTWRRAVGALAARLKEKGESYPRVAAIAGISRQHLVTCRREAQQQGTVQP
jgi:hypothetical protein